MKRVALNALLLTPRLGGVGVYIRHLMQGMFAAKKDWKPLVFLAKKAVHPDSDLLNKDAIKRVNIYSLQPQIRILSEYFLWPRILKKHKIDLLHSPISYIPPGVTSPAIVTVHDLRYFHYPETYTRLRGKFLEKMIPKSAHSAARILTVSNATKKDIVKYLNVSADKIQVIYEGIDAARFQMRYSAENYQSIKMKYRLPDRYLLSVGHLEPRKNYERLFESLAILADRLNLKTHLVIVGQENWYFQKIYDKVKSLKLSDYIHFTGFVDDADLPALYQKADLFIAPSLFEGFGFTPLEAMAAGIPVAASNTSSHPEILGDAAAYFNPYDPEDMAQTIKKILTDNDLRMAFVRDGHEQVKKFTWNSCCEQTFQEYENVLAK